MEMLIRIAFWSACFSIFTFFYNKKMSKEYNLKCEIAFSIVSSYAILTVVRSIVARISEILSFQGVLEELFVVICMLVSYGVYTTFCRVILKDNYLRWKYYLASMQSILSLGVFLAIGEITREIYFILFFFVYVISIIVVKWHNNAIEISSNRVWKTRLKFSLPVSLFVGTTFFIYLPSELYLSSPEIFLVNYWVFIWPLLLQFALFEFAYLVVTLLFATKQHYYLCNNICLTFGVLANVQQMFLNGYMQRMDGTPQQWGRIQMLVNIGIWVGVLGITLVVSKYFPQKVRDIFKVIGYCGVSIQGISLVILMITLLPTIKFDNFELTTEGAFNVAQQNNVFVFVLDSFDNQNVEQILERDEDFLKPLDGFVRYRNATGKYAFTDLGIPYLLTGIETKHETLEENYAVRAHQESNVLETISEAGYTIGLYTEAGFVGEKEQGFAENGRRVKRSLNIMSEIEDMGKVSRYKTYPFVFKNYFFYSDDDLVDIRVSDVEIHNVYNDVPFVKKLLREGLSIDKERVGAFKFYHLHGSHTAYSMNEEFENEETDILTQSRGCLKIVYEFVEHLKNAGLYEDAVIIITADHGQNFFDRPERAYELGMELLSSPIMFVKYAGEYGADMVVSDAPVSQDEVIPTVMNAIIGDSQEYGRTFEEIEENEYRNREFFFGRYDDIPFKRYVISGDALNTESWSEPEEMMK